MMEQRYGRIVNVSWNRACGLFGSAPYCAWKAGIMALGKVLAGEFGPYNITVNSIGQEPPGQHGRRRDCEWSERGMGHDHALTEGGARP